MAKAPSSSHFASFYHQPNSQTGCSPWSSSPSLRSPPVLQPLPHELNATVNFTPFKGVGCLQSENPHSPDKPQLFNITSGFCITPDYVFGSYFEWANVDLSTTPCSLSIFPEPTCGGQGVAATLSTFGECVPNQGGQSAQLNCGLK